MNDDAIKRLSEAELAEHIDGLEGQAWLRDLRSLHAQVDGQDLYALGFAAGQQSARPRRRSLFTPIATVMMSSIASAAATLLLMWQLSPSLERSSAERVAVDRSTPAEPATNQTAPRTLTQSQRETAEPDVDAWLLARMQPASLTVQPESSVDGGQGSIAIESERTRYVTQRQRWLSELATDMPE